MTILESFDGSSRKSKKMNAAKKYQGRQRLLLNIPQGQKIMATRRWLDTMLNISIDTPC